jgi:hypothetical protein
MIPKHEERPPTIHAYFDLHSPSQLSREADREICRRWPLRARPLVRVVLVRRGRTGGGFEFFECRVDIVNAQALGRCDGVNRRQIWVWRLEALDCHEYVFLCILGLIPTKVARLITCVFMTQLIYL